MTTTTRSRAHPRGLDRRTSILRLLASDGEVGVDDLAERLDVTASTIRRDLARMTAEGTVTRTLGGAVVGVGRGEEVYPLPDIAGLPCVIALPAAGVSTPQAFRDWDSRHSLTAMPPSATIGELSRSIAVAFGEPHSSGVFSDVVNPREDRAEDPLLALVRTGIENDFEQVVFPQHPFLGEIKRILVGGSSTEDAALYAGLSGSGSALFGLYLTPGAAQAAFERLERHAVTGLVTRTLPRGDYWRTMMVADVA